MHSLARLYTIESWLAFTAGGALLLLIFAVPASAKSGRSLFRWLVKILVVVAVLAFAGWGATNLWMRHLLR